jgi:predicted permease
MPDWTPEVRKRLSPLRLSPARESEIVEELSQHLEDRYRELIAGGASPEEAARSALAEFRGADVLARHMAPLRQSHSEWREPPASGRWSFVRPLWELARDMRFAVRSLWRAKGLAAAVIVTLGLGIGANSAVFSVVRGVLLRPLVNRDEDRLIYIRQTGPGVNVENYLFSMPEIGDFQSRATTVAAFGDFSTVDLALSGIGGDPRMVRAGVVNGSFFEVMGLHPVLGRLLSAQDDGPQAAGAAVLTYRFWSTVFHSDPAVVGKTIRLGPGTATIIGVLEPAVPYPTETEIMANLVTSPHHLGATMVTRRTHRMTELFGRLAPGVSLEAARAELTTVHAAMVRQYPEAYSKRASVQLHVAKLRDQIAAPARTILLVLLATAAIVFVIACSNVANLILARSTRRESELAVRAALGAGTFALRRTLLAESLVLCAAGAALGLLLTDPLVTLVSQYAARFSVRALDVTVDWNVRWIGVALAFAAAILLALVPRLPSLSAPSGAGGASGFRVTPGTKHRLQVFATTQIAFSFVLLAGAAMVLSGLVALQTGRPGYDMRHVLAFDIPPLAPGIARSGPEIAAFYEELARQIGSLPGVDAVAAGSFVPWRDAGDSGPRINIGFTAEGYTVADGEEPSRARFRTATPRFFSVVGARLVAGREFSEADRTGVEAVAIVSQSIAQRFFANGEAVDRHVYAFFSDGKPTPLRIVGVVADVDDESVAGQQAMMIYRPVRQMGFAGRLFVRAAGDPRSLVPAVSRKVHEVNPDQPVERAATLEEVRAEVLSPERVNAFVFSGFAGIALLIAVVGVAGVLAFLVSARTREFGTRLA